MKVLQSLLMLSLTTMTTINLDASSSPLETSQSTSHDRKDSNDNHNLPDSRTSSLTSLCSETDETQGQDDKNEKANQAAARKIQALVRDRQSRKKGATNTRQEQGESWTTVYNQSTTPNQNNSATSNQEKITTATVIHDESASSSSATANNHETSNQDHGYDGTLDYIDVETVMQQMQPLDTDNGKDVETVMQQMQPLDTDNGKAEQHAPISTINRIRNILGYPTIEPTEQKDFDSDAISHDTPFYGNESSRNLHNIYSSIDDLTAQERLTLTLTTMYKDIVQPCLTKYQELMQAFWKSK